MSTPSRRSYGGAHAVAVVFKIGSLVVIVGGVIALANVGSSQFYIGDKGTADAGIIAGTIFTAAAIAFFAYVLDLLIGIERNTTSGSPGNIQAAPPQAPVFPAPGWYSDPQGVTRVRFWDGQLWTDQTQT
jgi:hypothetical protein